MYRPLTPPYVRIRIRRFSNLNTLNLLERMRHVHQSHSLEFLVS